MISPDRRYEYFLVERNTLRLQPRATMTMTLGVRLVANGRRVDGCYLRERKGQRKTWRNRKWMRLPLPLKTTQDRGAYDDAPAAPECRRNSRNGNN